MIPVEVHLSLNHVPVVGLALGLVLFVSGLTRSATAAVLAGLRVFVAMGIVVLPVVGSELMSTTALANATWLDATAVSGHQLAGIVTLVVLVTLAALSSAMLWVSRKTSSLPRWGRTTILVLALIGFGTCLWTAYVGGRLRHSELILTDVGTNNGAGKGSYINPEPMEMDGIGPAGLACTRKGGPQGQKRRSSGHYRRVRSRSAHDVACQLERRVVRHTINV